MNFDLIKEKVETFLSDKFDGKVELTNVDISWYKEQQVYFSFYLHDDGDVYGEHDSISFEEFKELIKDEE